MNKKGALKGGITTDSVCTLKIIKDTEQLKPRNLKIWWNGQIPRKIRNWQNWYQNWQKIENLMSHFTIKKYNL